MAFPAHQTACPRRVHVFIAALLASVLTAGAAERKQPLSPEAALAGFQLEPGLRIELVAAEPLVASPVAFAFDEHRRLYVVEARGYPDAVDGSAPTKLGRVALLEDTNNDGRYDRRTEFATGFTNPNGIAIWHGGVFVTCAPDIYYLKDTNGDGVADERRVVLTGFDTTRTSQIRVSSPSLGMDGKIYVACGVNGGKVTSPAHPERPAVVFSPMDGRFDPETMEYETIGGRGQFGFSFDPFGRRFSTRSRDPVQHAVIEPRHLKRNPHLAFTETMQEVSKTQAEARVFPISRSSVSADFAPVLLSKPHAGTFTSACGLVVFGGSALTPEHVGNVFICEPAQNLVQRQVMRPQGASFRSELPYKGREFLSTTDVWFRPVFLGNGPDGALYLADMHRREIDHPTYVPEEPRGRLDFEGGKGYGRIYRIVRANQGSRPAPGQSVAELCEQLDSPDNWWRERAQRLLLERADSAAVPLLEKFVQSGRRPEGRTRALWTLHGLKKLSPAMLQTALRDADAGVREQAVTLIADVMDRAADFAAPLLALADDPDARVRYVGALALGSWEDARVVPALAKIAVRDGEDRWARVAVLSGIGSRLPAFMDELGRSAGRNTRAFALVMEDFGRVFGAGATEADCRNFLRRLLTDEGELGWRLPTALGLVDGIRGRTDWKLKAAPNPFVALLGGATPAGHAELETFFRRAGELAMDNQQPAATRASAVTLLGYTDFSRGGAVVEAVLNGRAPLDVQMQAVRAIERWGDARGAEVLTRAENWTRFTPQIRASVVAALGARPAMTKALLAAVKRGTLAPTEISPAQRGRLLKSNDPAIRQEAEALFPSLDGGDRMKIYQSYRAVLNEPADGTRGGKVFVRACSVCHSYNGVGGKVGPDLTGIRNQPADAVLLHIIVPNLEVAPGYQAVTVTTQDGRTVSGWMAGETDSSITLRTALGTEETVLRPSIASLSAPGLSVMPDGLEQAMTRQEMADLISYLKTAADL